MVKKGLNIIILFLAVILLINFVSAYDLRGIIDEGLRTEAEEIVEELDGLGISEEEFEGYIDKFEDELGAEDLEILEEIYSSAEMGCGFFRRKFCY